MGVKSRGSRLLGGWAAGIRAPCLLLLLEILGRRNLLPAGDGSWRALMVSVSLAAVDGARSRRGILVSIVTSWRRPLGWRSLHVRHARRGGRHGLGAPILHELGRRDGRGHGLRAAGRRGGAKDAGEGGIALLVVVCSVLLVLLRMLLALLRLSRGRHTVAVVVGHGCCHGARVSHRRVSPVCWALPVPPADRRQFGLRARARRGGLQSKVEKG